ncbi:MAG: hypothetical protein FJ304_18195 [Planctomycetes bacterium]|nr:hypothetical protein [Planctomycetota bacterium]
MSARTLEGKSPVLGIIISAAILGVIIAVMEEGEFPGWGKMVLCVLAAAVPQYLLSFVLPGSLFFVGTLVGAGCAMLAIMATCGMGPKRAGIAAGVYFAVGLVIGLIMNVVFRA